MRFTAGIVLLAMSGVGAPGDRRGETFTRPLGFQLGSMNLADVQRRLGAARLQHSGDAGESEYVVCYLAPRAGIQIEFKSGELGGNDQELLGFSMKAAGPTRQCRTLSPQQEGKLAFEIGGLTLGIANAAFRKALGETTMKEGGGLVAYFEYHDPSPPLLDKYPDGYANTLITVEGHFAEGRLTEISVWRVVTQ